MFVFSFLIFINSFTISFSSINILFCTNNLLFLYMHIFEALAQSKFVGEKEVLVVRILEEYNCRVSEVLKAEWKNFIPDKYLILAGLKRSRSIVVRDRDILSQISHLPRTSHEFIFHPVKYRRIYELCRRSLNDKVNIFKRYKNRKVTHYFRYSNVLPIDNEKFIQDILHHNSARSSGFYKKQSKGKSNVK